MITKFLAKKDKNLTWRQLGELISKMDVHHIDDNVTIRMSIDAGDNEFYAISQVGEVEEEDDDSSIIDPGCTFLEF